MGIQLLNEVENEQPHLLWIVCEPADRRRYGMLHRDTNKSCRHRQIKRRGCCSWLRWKFPVYLSVATTCIATFYSAYKTKGHRCHSKRCQSLFHGHQLLSKIFLPANTKTLHWVRAQHCWKKNKGHCCCKRGEHDNQCVIQISTDTTTAVTFVVERCLVLQRAANHVLGAHLTAKGRVSSWSQTRCCPLS